jgi:ATP-binding cassette, subfamily B, bacterial
MESSSPTFSERIRALIYLPKLFKLIWKVSPLMTVSNVILRVIRSSLPFAFLYVGKLIIDEVIVLRSLGKDPFSSDLWQLVTIEFVLAILMDILNKSLLMMDNLLGDLFSNHTTVMIVAHAANLDLDQFEDSVFYDKLERSRQQTAGRTKLLYDAMSQLQDIITIGFLVVGLMNFNISVVLLFCIAIIPSFLGESHFNSKIFSLTRAQTPERRKLDYLRQLGTTDTTAKEIKIFDLSDFIISQITYLSTKFYSANLKLSVRHSIWGLIFTLIGTISYYSAFVYIISQTLTANFSIGELIFIIGAFKHLKSLSETVLTRFTNISQGAIYLVDFFDFFSVKSKIEVAKTPSQFPNPIKHGFTFENIGFRYSNSDRWILRNLNFELRSGEKLALVGENGAGKTTLVKLITRLYEPSEGRILLDGIDLKEYDSKELRSNIGVIFQDFLRYHMTMSLNIAVGNIMQKDNVNSILSAAEKGLAHSFIEKLPMRYEQMLGKRFYNGVELSGGEWQKVAISRAYMRDAQLLILDEPTSALDARAENAVFERFSELTEGRSAIFISHRFSTVRMADRILVLEQGSLIEMGEHDELLRRGGRYAELFNLQAVGYK